MIVVNITLCCTRVKMQHDERGARLRLREKFAASLRIARAILQINRKETYLLCLYVCMWGNMQVNKLPFFKLIKKYSWLYIFYENDYNFWELLHFYRQICDQISIDKRSSSTEAFNYTITARSTLTASWSQADIMLVVTANQKRQEYHWHFGLAVVTSIASVCDQLAANVEQPNWYFSPILDLNSVASLCSEGSTEILLNVSK